MISTHITHTHTHSQCTQASKQTSLHTHTVCCAMRRSIPRFSHLFISYIHKCACRWCNHMHYLIQVNLHYIMWNKPEEIYARSTADEPKTKTHKVNEVEMQISKENQLIILMLLAVAIFNYPQMQTDSRSGACGMHMVARCEAWALEKRKQLLAKETHKRRSGWKQDREINRSDLITVFVIVLHEPSYQLVNHKLSVGLAAHQITNSINMWKYFWKLITSIFHYEHLLYNAERWNISSVSTNTSSTVVAM